MTDRSELLVTVLLAMACLVAASFAIVPRMTVRRVPIEFAAPDINVTVDGEVVVPGVYRVPFRSRVVDVLALAGGMTAEAESTLVDLAAPLGPGDRVHVPSKRSDNATGERISVNSAAADQLLLLPGVGPVTAERIIAGRPFLRIEDLLRVKGIGDKTLERLRDHIRP